MVPKQKNYKSKTNSSEIRLPHNKDAERATIGALLCEKSALYEVIDFLKPEMFHDEFLRQIYESILAVEATSQVDIITVTKEMQKRHNNVNVYEITVLSSEVASAAHIETHARIVYQDHVRRKLILNCAKTLNDANDMSVDVADLLDSHLLGVESISNTSIENETKSVSKVALDSFKAYQEREKKAKEGISVGMHTGLRKLDTALHGFQPGCVYILAARPGMGKTAIMLHIARKTAKHGNNVAVFSLEMTARSLVDRMVIAESGINATDFKSGRLSPDEFVSMADGQNNISMLPIEINDTASMTVQQIKSQAKKLKRKGKCDIILIDYLQLINMPVINGRNKNDEVSEASRAIKIMAKDLEVPVVLLSQLSRKVEERGVKMPMLSDLRDSGAIEQDADVILFLYRDYYYTEKEEDRNTAIIRIAKNREERTGDVVVWVNNSISDFKDEAHGKDGLPF